jgi:lipid-A-disaccharide synthase
MGWFGLLLLRILQVPSTVLPNLILDKPVMQEFLQGRCKPAFITPTLRDLLLDDELNQKCRRNLAELQSALSYEGLPPAQRAAEITLKLASSETV